MTAHLWQGQGPIHGIISYFGGLYPLTLGWTSRATGISFDALVSVVSWPFTLVLPLVLLALGRALWPRRALEPALLVLIGTVGSSLAFDRNAEWVFSVLPSGANAWPVYPRDVALVASIGALAVVLRPLTERRVVAAGLLVALAVCTQAQIGLYATVVTALLAVVTTRHRVGNRPAARVALGIGAVAALASSWWWIPRVVAAVQSGHLLLDSSPSLPRPDGSALGILNALGVVGLLAAGGLLVVWSGTVEQRFFGIWLLLFVPIVAFGGPLTDLGVITARRAWLFAAIPVVVIATVGAAALLRALPTVPVLAVLIVALAVPSTIEVLHTRDDLVTHWRARTLGAFGSHEWHDALGALRARTLADHGTVVLAPDVDAAFVWESTGAQPFSLWLSGSTKLGFDPAELTPWGYLERVRLQDAAFRAGLPGLCSLARRSSASALVLRHYGRLLGTHDRRPSAPYRVAPQDRTLATLQRRVAPGVGYRDLNSTEVLRLAPGARIPIGWASATVRRIDVGMLTPTQSDAMVLVPPSGPPIRPSAVASARVTRLRFDVHGVRPGTVLRARRPVTVERTTGFERSPIPLPRGVGAIVLATTDVCR